MAAISGGAVVRQGHLRKLKTMKKKYFVLRAETNECPARLEYYESEKKFRAGAAPRRFLPLKSCYNITRRLDLKQKHVIALFTREEQLCIVAENEQELHAWLTAILKLHHSDDASDELLHPIQHVWQVNVQKKGLGASKSIQGLYNLCLTDKTLTLVKIKSHNNIISDLGIPERVEYSLKNIRRCGDSECFFYMEVGRQTATGAGELWMHSEDSNIAQSMHSTIYHAMRNCAKETENEKDHIILSKNSLLDGTNPLPARRQTYSDGRGRAGLYNEKGLCVGSCIRQCVCSATYSIEDSAAALAPFTTNNDASTLRNRCDSMPSRACSSFESERAPPRHDLLDGLDSSRDDIDCVEWYRTPRIPEEPDCIDVSKDFINLTRRGASVQHSRTSSLGASSGSADEGYLAMGPPPEPCGAAPPPPPASLSSGSVCSGTPSTDPRFSEYQLEPAMSHIAEERSARAYSVGSRPGGTRVEPARLRAYSAGARRRPAPRPSQGDFLELDFSNNSPPPKVIVPRTPPTIGFFESKKNTDEYVDMLPRNSGYVEMKPGEPPAPAAATPATPDGYVEMTCGRPAHSAHAPPAEPPDTPPQPAPPHAAPHAQGQQTSQNSHHLSTVREISEDGRRSPDSSQYVTLAQSPSPELKDDTKSKAMDTTDNKTCETSPVAGSPGGALHYAALDLEPRRAPAAAAPRLYTQIDFLRSEQLHPHAT
ncbi:PREDICTED: insulin receptor substrate 1 [Papilio xuthus]|uniref:Insulin receptor substrate 1 n=1 Tax=Papilio xuthus TaxID=66420 RepID=A0AAJ7EJG1_PAPXU|nr:PREDICTED: insulin receptor substrate 1 [Papilio xuthus]